MIGNQSHMKRYVPTKKVSYGCSTLITYKNKRLLLTANHVIHSGSVQIELVNGDVHEISNPLRLLHSSPKEEKSDIPPRYFDLAVYFLPDEILLGSEENTLNLESAPIEEQKYNLSGRIFNAKGEWRDKNASITYLGVDDDNPWYYKFSKMNTIAGRTIEDSFEGCSGAPIFNERSEVISLVQGSSNERRVLFGVNLRYFKTFIDERISD